MEDTGRLGKFAVQISMLPTGPLPTENLSRFLPNIVWLCCLVCWRRVLISWFTKHSVVPFFLLEAAGQERR